MATYKDLEYEIEVTPARGYFEWIVRFKNGVSIGSKSKLLDTAESAYEEARIQAEGAIDDGAWHSK